MDPLQIPQSADDQLRALNAEMSLLRSRESNEKEKLGAFRSKVQEAGQSEYDALQEVHKARLADIQRRIEAIKATTQALRNVRTDVEEEAGGCEDGSTDAKGCNGKP